MRVKEWALILSLGAGYGGLLSNRADAATRTAAAATAKKTAASTSVSVDHFAHLGGMDGAKKSMMRNVLGSLFKPEAFHELGDTPPTGVLIYGPRLAGKTALAEATRNAIKARGGKMIGVDGHLISKPEQIVELFETAIKDATGKGQDGKAHEVAIFIDEIHTLGGEKGRTELVAELRQQMSDLQTMMADNPHMKRVVVIGATDHPDQVDSAITRKGFMEIPVEIKTPDEAERHDIFNKVTAKYKLAKDVSLARLVTEKTRGWTGGDIAKLTRTALNHAIERENPGADIDDIDAAMMKRIEITNEDFEHAASKVQPAALKNLVANNNEPVHFSDVIGAHAAKAELQRAIKVIKNPEAAKALGATIPRGIVMHGPPGNGKTMLARAMATDAGMSFIEIKPTVREGVVGASENNLQARIEAAKQHAPVVIFIDEADSLFAARGSRPGDPVHDSMVNLLLQNADGVEKLDGVVFVLATNRVDSLDSAIVGGAGQGGRFIPVHVGKPEAADRAEILAAGAKKTKLGKDVNFATVVKRTEGWSGRGTADLMKKAINVAFERDAKTVDMRDIEQAMKELGVEKEAESVGTSGLKIRE